MKQEEDIRKQKDSFNIEYQTLIAQKDDYSREAKRERIAKQELQTEKERLADEVSNLVAEFRSLQYLQDALEATSIEDSRSTMTLLHVVQQSYENPQDIDYAKHIVKKVLIVQTLGRVAFASSERARTAAIENWDLLETFLRKTDWFDQFLDGRHEYIDGKAVPEQIKLITTNAGDPAEIRSSLIGVSQALRRAIEEDTDEDKYLKPIRSMKARWFDQAQWAAEKLTKAAREGLAFEDVRLYGNQFWRMYCCELILVEGADVANAMVHFGNLLDKWEADGIPSDSVRKSVREKLGRLRAAALREKQEAESKSNE